MIKHIRAATLCAAVLVLAVPASAQNLSLRAPAWATPLIASDIITTTGGRAALAGDGIVVSARVSLASPRGGVARVVRYDQRADGAIIAVRRFTGHPSTGWWLWGPDAPLTITPTAAQRTELSALVRSAIGVGGAVGGGSAGETCSAGEQAFIELAVEGRATSMTRACVTNTDAAGRLALRLSELGGSRTEEELAAAGVAELMAADRAFAAKAAADGVPAAFTAFAASDALMVASDSITSGREGVTQRFAIWPEGARLQWAPEAGRVSARGDMGWTWGNSVHIAADGTRTAGRYVSVWTRDYEGNWRFAFDAAIR